MDVAVDLVILGGQPPEFVIGLPEPLDQPGMGGKFFLQFVRDVHDAGPASFAKAGHFRRGAARLAGGARFPA
jgi:hypothetical protein